MIHIVDIQFKLFVPSDGIAPINLGPAGNTRSHLMPSLLPAVVQGQVAYQKGAGTNQTHIAFEHIQQVWQLVERETANQATHGGQPLFIGQQTPVAVVKLPHGFELEQTKNLAPLTGPLLYKPRSPMKSRSQQQQEQ